MTTPIIDAHMHLWDLTHHRYPWLQDKSRPMWIGDYTPLKRDYLIEHYLADVRGLGVAKCVHLQAQWDHSDPVGETAWLQAIADRHGFPHGIVAFCQLDAPDAPQVIERQVQHRNVRGIRQDINWHPDALYRFCERPDYMTDPAWRRGLALLERYGLSFDLQIYAGHQGDDAYELVRAFPRIQFVLDHSGAPYDTTPEGRAHWQRKLARLAELPNVATKLSGFDMYDHRWTIDSLRDPIERVIDAFGPGRCLFASNFPVSSLYASYGRLLEAHQAVLARLSAEERRQILHDNAARVYRV